MPRPANSRGFTLIELMVVLAVFAILVVVAVPSFRDAMYRNRVATTTNELIAALGYARAEAVRLNASAVGTVARDVVLCSANAAATDCGGDWSAGWIVASRSGTDNVTVLRVFPAPNTLEVLSSPVGTPREFAFDNRGRKTSGPDFFTIQPLPPDCVPGREYVRTLRVNDSGQVRMERSTCP